MYEKEFSQRLAQLRLQKGISARDMSLSIGQNPGYINTIENGKSFPTMTNFFYICEYLNITPEEFFDMSSDNPETLKELIENIKLLNSSQLDAVTMIVNELLKKKNLSINFFMIDFIILYILFYVLYSSI